VDDSNCDLYATKKIELLSRISCLSGKNLLEQTKNKFCPGIARDYPGGGAEALWMKAERACRTRAEV
jgi:hypothetical protein